MPRHSSGTLRSGSTTSSSSSGKTAPVIVACSPILPGLPTGSTSVCNTALVVSDGPLRVGIALQHAGLKLQLENRDQADPLPTRLQYGAAYKVDVPIA